MASQTAADGRLAGVLGGGGAAGAGAGGAGRRRFRDTGGA